MSLLSAIMIPLVLAGLLPFANAISEIFIERVRKAKALKRLQDDPLVYTGSRIVELRSEGSDRPLIENCKIGKLEIGNVVVVTNDKSKTMNFTAREFELLHPVFEN